MAVATACPAAVASVAVGWGRTADGSTASGSEPVQVRERAEAAPTNRDGLGLLPMVLLERQFTGYQFTV
ncbi:hypothetical protein P3T29_003369 [Kitasatospora sp. MAP5-34]|nr:hypothetical protein [Kitasatospora sp. MAP5-34]